VQICGIDLTGSGYGPDMNVFVINLQVPSSSMNKYKFSRRKERKSENT
jgi:hypothetical protein